MEALQHRRRLCLGQRGLLQSCSHQLLASQGSTGAPQPPPPETQRHQKGGGRPAQAPPHGADRHLDGFVESGLLYGQGPEMGIQFRPLPQVVIPSEAGSLTSFSFFDPDKKQLSLRGCKYSVWMGEKKKKKDEEGV